MIELTTPYWKSLYGFHVYYCKNTPHREQTGKTLWCRNCALYYGRCVHPMHPRNLDAYKRPEDRYITGEVAE